MSEFFLQVDIVVLDIVVLGGRVEAHNVAGANYNVHPRVVGSQDQFAKLVSINAREGAYIVQTCFPSAGPSSICNFVNILGVP